MMEHYTKGYNDALDGKKCIAPLDAFQREEYIEGYTDAQWEMVAEQYEHAFDTSEDY